MKFALPLENIQRYALYLLLFLAPISKASIEILFPVLLAAWLIRRLRTEGVRASRWTGPLLRPVFWAAVFYLLFAFLSIFASTNPQLSVQGFFRKTLEYVLFFFIAADTLAEEGQAKAACHAVIASAVLICADGLFQEFTGWDFLRGHSLQGFARMTGPFENPNDLAIYLLVVFPLVLAWAFAREKTSWLRWAAVVLVAGSLIRTMYVSGLAVTLAGIAIFASVHKESRKIVAVFAAGLFLAAAMVQTVRDTQWKRFFVRYDEHGHATGLQDRLWMWGAGWEMLKERPILGVGLNTFMDNYLDYRVGGEAMPRYAHNCYLQTAAETGVLGVIAFVSVLGFSVRSWIQGLPRIRDPGARLLLIGLAIGLFDFMVQAFVDTNLYAIRHAALFWTLVGMLCGAAQMAREKPS